MVSLLADASPMLPSSAPLANAVDDLVRTLYFYPAFQTPETMRQVDTVYDTDPMNVNGVEKTLRTSMIDFYRKGQSNYNRCDKPVYHLLNVDARAPLIANNDGRVSGNTIQLSIYRVAKGIEPFECQFVSYQDDSVSAAKYGVTREGMTQPNGVSVLVYNLLWNASTKRWMVYYLDALPVSDYAMTAKALWDASPMKP